MENNVGQETITVYIRESQNVTGLGNTMGSPTSSDELAFAAMRYDQMPHHGVEIYSTEFLV
jgi:hypothetical protein